VLAVRDLAAAMAFYERLGFAVRHHDAGYGYAERGGLRLHLRASPELGPFSSYTEVYARLPAARSSALCARFAAW
jgi:catechol 2,3-dioxygenase-like lactoylglutathione lyase family enzyme